MAEIFISYASSDRDRARELADRLAARGYQVWWDRTIPPGRVFDEVIQEALHEAKCVIVLWSAQSVASNWVKTEAAEGMTGERLVPALIERVVPPIEFKRIQAADLADWHGDAAHPEYRKLIGAVDALVKQPSGRVRGSAPPIGVQSYQPARGPGRRGLVIGALVALALVAAGGYLLGKRGTPAGTVAEAPRLPPAQPAEQAARSTPSSNGTTGSAPATSPSPAKAGRINLIAAENGGEIVTASTERWTATVDGKEDTYTWVDSGQAVYAFKDGRAATFDAFAVLIPSTSDNNLGEFEILAGNDGASGQFTSLGIFKPQNVRIMKQPFQEFRFAPVKAKYLKFRSLKAANGSSGAVMAYEFQLWGTLE
jgi:hypothetical protein